MLRALAAGATGTAAAKASGIPLFSGIPLPADGPGPCVFSPAVLSPYTWLRVKSRGEMTPEHADYFHFKRMTPLLNRRVESRLPPAGQPRRSLPALLYTLLGLSSN